MFCTDKIMLEAPGFFLRECKYSARPFGEFIKAATTCRLSYWLCPLGCSLYGSLWRMLYERFRNRGTKCFQRSESHLVRRYAQADRKSTRLNSSHVSISYAVFCL